jgi:predicted permease
MPWLTRSRAAVAHLAGLLQIGSRDQRLDEEVRFHIEMETEKGIRAGMSPEDARRAALVSFGGRGRWTDESRDQYRSRPLHDLGRDLRYAARTLIASPGFTLAAVATLAIGIGANTAIFSAVDGVLLKPLPFTEDSRIVSLFETDLKKRLDREGVAPGNFASWKEQATAFSGIAVAEPFALAYSTPEGVEQFRTWQVTSDFFSILGARAHLGRVFEPTDFARGRGLAVILTFASWQKRFGADPHIVGKTIRLDDAPATIVGVLPRDFSYLADGRREIFTPKVLDSAEVNLRYSGWYHAIAKLGPGVTAAQAVADLDRVADRLARDFPRTNQNRGIAMVPIRETIVGGVSRVLVLLLGAVGLVLLIACTNVANLVLARTTRRSREFAIRAALGAARARIIRQMMAESFLLALIGGAAGVAFAYWALGAIRGLSPADLPRLDEMRIDERALAFTFAAVVATTMLFGLVPAIRATEGSRDELKAGGRATGSGHRRLRGAFVATEVALAMVLLVAAGLLVRSFISVIQQDRGYRSDHVTSAMLFIWDFNRTPSMRRDFVMRLEDRALALPGVIAAGTVTSLPLSDAIGADDGTFTVVGKPVSPGEEPRAHISSVTPGAFRALRMELKQGRLFTRGDDSGTTPVAVISESMATRYWPGEDVVGKHLIVGFYGRPIDRQIVGVVGDVRHAALDAPAEPTIYLPHAQSSSGSVELLVRTTQDPALIGRDIKRMIREINPQLPVARLTTLDAVVDDSLRPRRFMMVLFASFSLAALALAIVGVYGVIAQATTERYRELGVRIALGAQGGDIVRMVMRDGLLWAGGGVVAGAVVAAAFSRLLGSMLFAVTPLDAATYLGVAGIMMATAMAASYLPARRATRIDPLKAIRVG